MRFKLPRQALVTTAPNTMLASIGHDLCGDVYCSHLLRGYPADHWVLFEPREASVVKKVLALLSAFVGLFLLVPAVSQAITNGQPDQGAHPYVGELLFYVPDEVDARFTDPGSWFTCSGTLL